MSKIIEFPEQNPFYAEERVRCIKDASASAVKGSAVTRGKTYVVNRVDGQHLHLQGVTMSWHYSFFRSIRVNIQPVSQAEEVAEG